MAPTEDTQMAVDPKETPAAPVVVDEAQVLASDLAANIALMVKSEPRYTTRALRTTSSLRKRLVQLGQSQASATTSASNTKGVQVLYQTIQDHLPSVANAVNGDLTHPTLKEAFLTSLAGVGASAAVAPMEVETKSKGTQTNALASATAEIELYLGYLVLIYLHDTKHYAKGLDMSNHLIRQLGYYNKRNVDPLGARLYFYHARFYELHDKWLEVRPMLLAAHRTATLRHDIETQATLLNILLRNYLHFNHYEQADKLVSKTVFPETAGNSQLARYFYFLGRIKAIQLDYTSSHKHLSQALRKVLATPATAGFQQAVNKLSIIVQLLMGEIPERSVFRQPILRKALAPYLSITSAVRVGDLHAFTETLAKHATTFQADKTYSLILRLRHNVIKTGIRMISLSYSRISLKDVCLKLQLDSEEDAEYIVAKAIRDGVVDAMIDHEKGYIQSKENVDIYSTNEPQHAFDQRISFCLNVHNESVQAMRYPMNVHKKELEQATLSVLEDNKLANEIMAEEDDDDMGEF